MFAFFNLTERAAGGRGSDGFARRERTFQTSQKGGEQTLMALDTRTTLGPVKQQFRDKAKAVNKIGLLASCIASAVIGLLAPTVLNAGTSAVIQLAALAAFLMTSGRLIRMVSANSEQVTAETTKPSKRQYVGSLIYCAGLPLIAFGLYATLSYLPNMPGFRLPEGWSAVGLPCLFLGLTISCSGHWLAKR